MKNKKELFKRSIVTCCFMLLTLFFWCLPSLEDVKAADGDRVLNISQPGEYVEEFEMQQYKKSEASFVIRNTGSSPLCLEITETIPRTDVISTNKLLSALEWDNSRGTTPLQAVMIFAPGEEDTLRLGFRSDYAGGTKFVIKATQSRFSDNGGKTFAQAKKTELVGSESGFLIRLVNGDAKNKRYFMITAAKKRYLNLKLTVDDKNIELRLYKRSDSSMSDPLLKQSLYDETVTKNLLLDPGEYVIELFCTKSYENAPASYTLDLSGRDYIPATGVTLTCTEKNRTLTSAVTKKPRTFHFKATTIPADSDDKLKGISVSGDLDRSGFCTVKGKDIAGSNSKSFTVTYDGSGYAGYSSGYSRIKVTSTNGKTSKAIDIVAKPGKPVVTGCETTYNRITIGKLAATDLTAMKPVRVYMKVGKKWKLKTTRKNSKAFTLKGLKANTKYQLKFVTISKKPGGGYIEGEPLVKTLKTGPKVTPSIRSIQISNVRVSSGKKWVKDFYQGWVWKTYYTTYYKITIHLNKPMAGTQGLCIGNLRLRGRGTSFSTTLHCNGNALGRSTSITIGGYNQNSDVGGYGPVVRRTITIR